MNFVDWGLINYTEATKRQLALVEQFETDTIVFCSHPPVVTVGRATKPEDLIGWKGDIVEVSRGGRATYHGPSQLVVYPILDLSRPRNGFGARDLHGYMRSLESAVVATLGKFGITALGGHTVKARADQVSRTGVWVANGDKKIASIGIACKKWVAYHGLALNVTHDPLAFSGIQPCGMNSSIMTSIEEILRRKIDRAAITDTLKRELQKLF